VDPLDLGILRELSRDQIVWFGRLDPRFSAAEIARRLHVDRAAVSSRLSGWERAGFLRSHEVVPSPLDFGAGIAGGNLRVDDLLQKPAVLDDLALIPGLISAVDQVGPWVALLFAFETRDGLERSRRLLGRMAGVSDATPCVPFVVPEPSVVPTRVDWEILHALRASPRRPLREVTETANVSTKTLVRRMERLVEGRAVWYLPVLDFPLYPRATVARFVVTLRSGADPVRVSEALARMVPGISHLIDTTNLLVPKGPVPPILDIGAHHESVGQAQDVQREIARVDSVDDVEVLFPRRFYLYRGWFDEHIEAVLARSSPRAPRPAPSRGDLGQSSPPRPARPRGRAETSTARSAEPGPARQGEPPPVRLDGPPDRSVARCPSTSPVRPGRARSM
jgi:DNA-binding Lrp family transcriptional regulator